MIGTGKNTEQVEEGKLITITGVVSKLYFQELMDGKECFHDVEWDVQDYDTAEPSPLEIDIDAYENMTWETPSDELEDAVENLLAEVKRLREELKQTRESLWWCYDNYRFDSHTMVDTDWNFIGNLLGADMESEEE